MLIVALMLNMFMMMEKELKLLNNNKPPPSWMDRVIVPPNRTFSVQPHLPLWEGLNASYCRDLSSVPPTRESYGRAYPDQVSGHNLVCSFLRFLVPVPEWECPRVGVDHDGGRGVFGRHGAT